MTYEYFREYGPRYVESINGKTGVVSIKGSDSVLVKKGNDGSLKLEVHPDIVSGIGPGGDITIEEEVHPVSVAQALDKVYVLNGHLGEGLGSICLGSNSTTAGENSICLGNVSTASGLRSIAVGQENSVTGSTAIAMGRGNSVTGDSSVGIGQSNDVSNHHSYAFGYINEVPASECVAIGQRNGAGGQRSCALGYQNNVSSRYGIALGQDNVVSGEYSSAFGFINDVSGSNTVAIGREIVTDVNGMIIIGGPSQHTKITRTLMVGNEVQPDYEGPNAIFGSETYIVGNEFRAISQDTFGTGTANYGSLLTNETDKPRFTKRSFAEGIETGLYLSNANNVQAIEEAVLYSQRSVENEDATQQQLTVAHDSINVGNREGMDAIFVVNGKATIGNSTRDGALEVLGEARMGRNGTNTVNLRVYGKSDIPGYQKIVDPTTTAQETGESYFGKKVYIKT
ncbi:hypothetical protein FACS189472_07800 [Alphaproteobacteria bacterium]|nr:hypothetical protein FACS189472_07800 [Alphaproteobacteria bacterium]